MLKKATLFEAAKAGWLPEIRQLIGLEPELLDSFSNEGFTALSLACIQGHYAVVKYLLEMGASTDIKISAKAEATPLHLAVSGEHYPVAKILIGHGADVNVADKNGCTPLHLAALNGNINLVQLLTNHNARIKIADSNGKKPIDYAKSSGREEVIKFFQKKVAD